MDSQVLECAAARIAEDAVGRRDLALLLALAVSCNDVGGRDLVAGLIGRCGVRADVGAVLTAAAVMLLDSFFRTSRSLLQASNRDSIEILLRRILNVDDALTLVAAVDLGGDPLADAISLSLDGT